MERIFEDLAQDAGIHFMGVDPRMMDRARAQRMAMDAQPGLITSTNSGVLAMLSTEIDPKLIEVLVAPMKAAEVTGGEIKKGNWVTDTIAFPVVESTGQSTSYGDYSNSGASGVNVNWPQRQSYHYQVMSQWGERELERAGLAKLDYASRIGIAGVLTLNKFQNKTYFFGVSGLQNYGLLNDPSLPAALSPSTKAASGVTWVTSGGVPNATALEVLKDIQKMYIDLQSRAKGQVQLDTRMRLAMSPRAEVAMTFTNDYNVNVADLLKKNYPNLTLQTAPEYSTTSGELVQLFAEELEGQRTVDCAFTEKLRAHPIVVAESSFKQKKSAGTWGTVIYRPAFFSQLLGV
jgi:hypothetical protein